MFEGINGISLDLPLPPPSKQKELLNTMLLNLTAEEYDAKMQTMGFNSNLANNSIVGATPNFEDNEIVVNESEAVFGF